MAVITLPINIEFMEWAQQLSQDLPKLIIQNPTSEDLWRDWAAQLLVNNSLFAVPIPNKQLYPTNEDWKKWAAYFVNSVYNN